MKFDRRRSREERGVMLRAEHLRVLLVALSLVVGLGLGAAPRPAAGHGDDAAAPPSPGVRLSPRLVARSGDFELVGVARGRTLSIYLDRFADNQPVTGAKLDVEADGQTVAATAGPSGTYTLTANWVAQAGRHAVIVTIVSDQGSDLLAGTLDIAPAPTAASPSSNGGGLPARSGDNLLAFLFGMLATVALQRRSSLAAMMRGTGDRVRRRGGQIVGAARRRVGDASARLRQADPVAQARSFAIRALRGFQSV